MERRQGWYSCPVVPAHTAALGRARSQKITGQHIRTLMDRGVTVIEPVSKKLACGDVGRGAMAAPAVIVKRVVEAMNAYQAAMDEADKAGKAAFVP